MIRYFTYQDGTLQGQIATGLTQLPHNTIWIDLFDPTAAEECFIEETLQLNIPTRAEMADIEISARLYTHDTAQFMTAVVVTGITERHPVSCEVTFVLSAQYLVSVRYADPLPFRCFETQNQRQLPTLTRPEFVFIALIQSIVRRIADVLKIVEQDLEALTAKIFNEGGFPLHTTRAISRTPRMDLQNAVKHLGRSNALIVKLRESLLSITMLLAYFQQSNPSPLADHKTHHLSILEQDVRSLSDYQAQMSVEIAFLLDVTLGLINIEQNSTIKVFSIAAVLFLPPTLVGTIYGMNFHHMPELAWGFGYPIALLLMVLSAIVPYAWFKYRGWL